MYARADFSHPHVDWARIRRLSVMSEPQLHTLHSEALKVIHLPGDVAELGVYRGGSALLLAQTVPRKSVFAFESFTGLTNLTSQDLIRSAPGERGHAHGDFAIRSDAERSRVRRRLAVAGVRFCEGLFSDCCDEAADAIFCFAHFDADSYESAWQFLEFFFPRLVPGGRLVLDDVGWPATPGVCKAMRDYFGGDEAFDVLPNFQAVVVK